MTRGGGGLGAIWSDGGVDFRLRAPGAAAVDLCLFAAGEPPVEQRRVALERDPGGTWRARVEGAGPGTLYGYRVDGPFEPADGWRFDRAKLLLDPRAGAVAGRSEWHPALIAGNGRDSAPYTPRSVVVDPAFDWGDDRRPRVPWERTLLYECHVRGLTRRHPRVPSPLRGTYLGLAEPPVVEHLLALGVTAVELMPVQHFVAERHLAERGRDNYWGYSPIAWFAPHAGYASTAADAAVREFKTMVRRLHAAGLEVILDVVLNHTAEGGANGLTLGPRGIDNAGFYRLDRRDRSRYVDYTGCGNTIDLRVDATRELVLDALRYWAGEMRVDGFRFDLAGVLGRADEAFSAAAPFFRRLAEDPLLASLKLIAEPWDLGPGGYLAGAFPDGWREWNDRFRDGLRSFWRGDPGTAGELATRMAGSSDLYRERDSAALTGINYVTCHDGFTLEDLVSYARKHNHANGEDNRDGRDENLSRNWGVEGPTDDRAVAELRLRVKKNLLATLALSAGVPMLAHGDEMGRTQRGNNNAYCHDSPLTWADWELDADDAELLDFSRRVFALRRRLAVLGHRRFLTPGDLDWYHPEGRPLGPDDWRQPGLGTLVACLRSSESALALLLHAGGDRRAVRLPPVASRWKLRLATAEVDLRGDVVAVPPYSLAAFDAAFEPGAGPGAEPPNPDSPAR